jgi:hypothetical protein
MASQSALKQIPTGLIPGDMTFAALTATATLTAAQSFNSILRGVPVAAATYTTATAAEILAAIGGDVRVGSTFEINLLNASAGANTITFAGGTGVTISGVATTVQNGSKRFIGVVDNVASPAITIYAFGTVASAVA